MGKGLRENPGNGVRHLLVGTGGGEGQLDVDEWHDGQDVGGERRREARTKGEGPARAAEEGENPRKAHSGTPRSSRSAYTFPKKCCHEELLL